MSNDIGRLNAALADRYAIEAEIDTGGMATVYRARDLKHERTVAIKVLRPDLAEAIGADRFLREIRTTANLSHPHILPLFDSGEAGGLLFYVMPFVEGESLRDRLEREGQLPVEDAVQIAQEVADALAYAHEKGTIHRDVKPANILLERGHALLADFGIAQAKAGMEETRLTGSGMSLGTPSYMSPEQITGNREVDGRSDQYALGCVLYEMLAGHPPFTGADIQTVMRQHLAADAPGLTGPRPSVPRGAAKAVHRALAKAPADRFRTMTEFEKALAGATVPFLARVPMGRARAVIFVSSFVLALAAGAVIASRRGTEKPKLARDLVAVIPFSNRTSNDSLDDLAMVATNATAVCLDQSGIVDVVPSESVLDYWAATSERRQLEPSFDARGALAARFGAGVLVEGSILPGMDSLQLTGWFMEAEDISQTRYVDPVVMARERPDETAALRKLCGELSAALAIHLDTLWSNRESARAFTPPPSPEAMREWRAAAEAFYYRNDAEKGLGHCDEVRRLHPTYAPAKLCQAAVNLNLQRFPTADSILAEVEKSSDLLALTDQTWKRWLRAVLAGDREGAYSSMKDGHYGDPTWILLWGSEALKTNRLREALKVFTDLDPEVPLMQRISDYWVSLSSALHVLADHERELRDVLRGRERHPEEPGVLRAEIRARAALGRIQEVNDLLDEAISREAQPTVAFQVAALELRAHGFREASLAVGERALAYLRERLAPVDTTASSRFQLLEALYVLERWEEAQPLAEDLVRGSPTSLRYLRYSGALAARRGQPEEARAIAERIASMEIPYDRGRSTQIRAGIAALLGEKDQAVSLLRQAYQQGWAFSVDLHTDPDLEPLRGYEPFEAFIRPRG